MPVSRTNRHTIEQRHCEEWILNPLVNPITNHTINAIGPTSTLYRQVCLDGNNGTNPNGNIINVEENRRRYRNEENRRRGTNRINPDQDLLEFELRQQRMRARNLEIQQLQNEVIQQPGNTVLQEQLIDLLSRTLPRNLTSDLASTILTAMNVNVERQQLDSMTHEQMTRLIANYMIQTAHRQNARPQANAPTTAQRETSAQARARAQEQQRQEQQESFNTIQQQYDNFENRLLVLSQSPNRKSSFASSFNAPSIVAKQCENFNLIKAGNPFYRFSNKLKKICTSYTNHIDNCDNLVGIKVKLNAEIKGKLNDEIQRIGHLRFELIPKYNIASVLKHYNLVRKEYQSLYLFVKLQNMLVTYKNQRGVGLGVVRNFLQGLANELDMYKILAPPLVSGEEIKRYIINPNFVPDDNFKQHSDMSFENEEDFITLYKFVGHILSLILINNVYLNFKLSYHILANMIYQKSQIKDEDYVGFAMMDFPVEFNMFNNLMISPNTIEHASLPYNPDPSSIDERLVTIENFRSFLILRSKHRYLHSLTENDMTRRFDAMVKGLQPVKVAIKALNNTRVTIPMLDNLISSLRIDDETLSRLIEHIKTRIVNQSPKFQENIVSILNDKGKTFPYAEIGIDQAPTKAKEQQVIFDRFLGNLLAFWTSIRNYDSTFNYKIIIKPPTEISQQGTAEMLPTSHTCFQELEIPNTYHNNRDKLYKKLVQAAYLVESGIGNY